MSQLARDMLREVAKAAKKNGRRRAMMNQLRKVHEILNEKKAASGEATRSSR